VTRAGDRSTATNRSQVDTDDARTYSHSETLMSRARTIAAPAWSPLGA